MLTVHRGIGGDSVRYTGRKDDSDAALATQSDLTALKSGFKVSKVSMHDTVFDFSHYGHTDGREAFKFKTNKNGSSSYVTFGSTEEYWNFDWAFTGAEKFRWVRDGSVTFQIDQSGPASVDYQIVDFITPASETAPATTNVISVKTKLTEYETKLTAIKDAVAASTDFDSLKAALLAALT